MEERNISTAAQGEAHIQAGVSAGRPKLAAVVETLEQDAGDVDELMLFSVSVNYWGVCDKF